MPERVDGQPVNLNRSQEITRIEIPRTRTGRIYWAKFKTEPEKLTKLIEEEAREFVAAGGELSKRPLERSGRNDLAIAIQRHYPGKMRGIKEKLGMEPGSGHSFRIRKQILGYYDTPEQTNRTREEARKILETDGSISSEQLRKNGNGHLAYKISKHYPGGWPQLRNDLGLEEVQKPRGYWDVDRIRAEIETHFSDRTILITHALLKDNGLAYLSAAIDKHFPGGIIKLNEDRGNESERKSRGYWDNPENIEKEASSLIQLYGGLSQTLMHEHSRDDLIGGIRKYPGGMQALKINLGIQPSSRPKGYWEEVSNIESEAKVFYERERGFTQQLMAERGSGSLWNVIQKNYPGGMEQMKVHLGIDTVRKPNKYWTPEIIEKEAIEFYEQFGNLSIRLLSEAGRNDLASVISKKYPGGFNKLKEKIGIVLGPQVNIETGCYMNERGENMITALALARRLGYSYFYTYKYLKASNIPSINGRDKNGNEVILYFETEAIVFLKDNYKNRRKVVTDETETQVIPADEANEGLDEYFKEE